MSGDLRKRPRLRLDLEHYRELKTKILERDGWKCQRCGRVDQLLQQQPNRFLWLCPVRPEVGEAITETNL